MAKAAIETAVWDAEAKHKGLPLWKLLGGAREEIPCGVSIGIKDTVEELARHRRTRTGRRLPAHQNQNQAGERHRPDPTRFASAFRASA